MTLPPHSQKYIDQFLAGIRPMEEAYRDDTFAYLALKDSSGFILIQGSLFLNIAPRQLPSTSFQSQNIRAGHHKLTDLKVSRTELIEQICAGKLRIPDGDLLFPGNSSGNYGTMYVPFHTAGLQTQSRLSVLSIFGADSREQIDQLLLDWELRAAPTPYDGLQDLLNEYQLGILRGVNSVEVIAFSVAAIDANSKIDGEIAKLSIRTARGLNPQKVTVGVRVLDQGRIVERTLLGGDKFEWVNAGDHWQGTVEFNVPRAAVVQCTANYNGVAQQYYWIVDPNTFQNSRRAAYEAFDPGFDLLKDIFAKAQGRGPDAKTFESAISWLFWMLGFSPVHLGGTPRTQDAADIILCAPNGHFAIVECTTGLLKAGNKLPLLHDRAQAVRRNLDASNATHLRVVPILVSSKTREEVLPDMEQAERAGIYVLTREGIERLAERTIIPSNADQLYEQAEQAVKVAIQRHEAARSPTAAIPGI